MNWCHRIQHYFVTSQNAIFTEDWLSCKSEVNTSYFIYGNDSCRKASTHTSCDVICTYIYSYIPCNVFTTLSNNFPSVVQTALFKNFFKYPLI